MMKPGDRVQLKRDVAERLMTLRQSQRHFDWRLRVGTVHHCRKNRTVVEVIWDGRASMDPWDVRELEAVARVPAID